MTIKRALFAAMVAASAVALSAENSMAFWGWRGGGSCGSHGGWARGSGGSWGGGWGSGGSWGGGSWGSGGSWGGGSWGSGGGHYGGYTSYSNGGYARNYTVTGERYVSASPSRATVAQSAAKTRLTLHVPSDAKVTLAGVETKQAGEVRNFSTNKLAGGQVWVDYTIVVEAERNGQTIREERTIKLTGGESHELAVSLGSTQLAQATR